MEIPSSIFGFIFNKSGSCAAEPNKTTAVLGFWFSPTTEVYEMRVSGGLSVWKAFPLLIIQSFHQASQRHFDAAFVHRYLMLRIKDGIDLG